jgi:peroxiredoxin
MELNALQQKLPEIEQTGAKLVAISPETPDNSLTTQERNTLAFDILYDQGNTVAKTFGLVFELPQVLRPIYERLGLDIPGHNGDETFELPVPATYIINREGKILYHFIDADYTRRSEPEEIVAALSAHRNQQA